jgi:hypothetical protein
MKKPVAAQTIIAELTKILKPNDLSENVEAYTSAELMEILGDDYGEDKVLSGLRKLKKEGKLKCVYTLREDITGKMTKRPGYILIDKEISTG